MADAQLECDMSTLTPFLASISLTIRVTTDHQCSDGKTAETCSHQKCRPEIDLEF